MKKILIIQTAFIGDVILATSVVESLSQAKPEAEIYMLIRKGNESLLLDHPKIKEVLVWNKEQNKYKNLLKLGKRIRSLKFDLVLNLHRFSSSGYLTWRSGAKVKAGFQSASFSRFFTTKVPHEIGNGKHEIERNHSLLEAAIGEAIPLEKPKLYPSEEDYETIEKYEEPFVVMAPASVWFTKQLPKEKWVELIQSKQAECLLFIGGPGDREFLDEIIRDSSHKKAKNLAGELSLLQSAALISKAKRTYVNDSAPLHLTSAMDAPVTAFFCSTIPAFGFGPLSSDNHIVEVSVDLDCRPCGLHGYRACPKGHFKCGHEIRVSDV